MVKNLPARQETWVQSLGQEDSLEKGMITCSSILAWRIPWTKEAGGLQSMGLQSDTTVTNTFTFTELTPQMTSSESCQGITLMLPRHSRNVSSHFLGCPLKALSPTFSAAASLLRNIFSG